MGARYGVHGKLEAGDTVPVRDRTGVGGWSPGQSAAPTKHEGDASRRSVAAGNPDAQLGATAGRRADAGGSRRDP